MNQKIYLFFFIVSISYCSYGQYFPNRQREKIKTEVEKNKIGFNSIISNENNGKANTYYINSYVLRKSVSEYFADSNSKLANEGALFAFTFPKGKSSSSAMNIGVVYSWNKVSVVQDSILKVKSDSTLYYKKELKIKYIKTSYSFHSQFDKNTLIDATQNNIYGGVCYIENWANYDDFDSPTKVKFYIPIKLALDYRKDFENSIDAIQTSLIFSPQLFKLNDSNKLGKANWFGFEEAINMDLDFKVGLEYDYRFEKNNSTIEGNIFRTFSKVVGTFKLKKYFITYFSWENRYLLNNTNFNKDSFSLLKFGLNYKIKFSNDKNIFESIEPEIGIVYENGENPINGFNDQSFWAIALSLKI